MNLSQIQIDFIDAFFGGEKEAASAHIIGNKTLSAEQRLGIYRGSVHGILTQALGLTFPVCKALVGEKFFDKMCTVFIDQYPPKTSFFTEYGNHFSTFLRTFKHVETITYIADIAKLEWFRHEIWHKKTQLNITPEKFAELAELAEAQQHKVIFQLTNTVRLIQSKYRIDNIWFAHQDDSKLTLDDIEINEETKLLIWKEKGSIKISLMTNTEADNLTWFFLDAISKNKTLEQLAEQFGEELPKLLNQGIVNGWIESFKIPSI